MQKDEVIAKARALVAKSGFINMTRQGLAAALGISDGSFHHEVGCSFNDLIEELRAMGVTDPVGLKVVKNRADPALRKEAILRVALDLASRDGYLKITRQQIAEAAGVSTGVINQRFGTMDSLRSDLMRRAVKMQCLPVIAQGLVSKNPHAMKAPIELKEKSLGVFSGQ